MHDKRFQFGKNWLAYLERHFSEQALANSVDSLKRFLPVDLSDKTFLDVGCGSGIHSLAALRLGARRVVSFDYDNDAVSAAARLKADVSPESQWTVERGSLLDPAYLHGLGTFDVVYCWGVAHHTGEMWKALSHLPALVAPGGFLFVAIYNTVDGRFGSAWWLRVKRFYNSAPQPIKKILGWCYIAYHFSRLLVRLRNPFRIMREYEYKRGMSWNIDRIDWLGGYPYEYAKPEEVFSFFRARYGMDLVALKTTRYIGCNQFVFRRP